MRSRIKGLVCACVAGGISLALLGMMTKASPKQGAGLILPSAALQRQLVSVLLRESGGNQLGSGVLVSSAPPGYWVITNRHVVQENVLVCVVTADRRAAAGLVWPRATGEAKDSLDLALVWLPAIGKEPLMVASIRQGSKDSKRLPIVISTGYPTSLQPRVDGPTYTETTGLLVPLLQAPLQGGFDLSYTADVEKGMSGGGVFEGTELIGINGTHANPLWPGQWNSQDGKALDEGLQHKLELVSLGISADTIVKLLKAAVPPSAKQLEPLAQFACNASSRSNASTPSGTTF